MNGKISLCLLVAGVMMLCGCNRTRLPGGYTLECFQDLYYVVAPGNTLEAGGALDGTIEKIGWNHDWILAKVTRIYRGDPDGWYALNVRTGRIRGPLDIKALKADPVLSQIKCRPPAAIRASKT